MAEKYLNKTGLSTLWSQIKLLMANFADNKSIEVKTEKLQIKGFDEAAPGYMPVKDADGGIDWQIATSSEALDQAVRSAQAAATQSSNYAATSGNSASASAQSAAQAQVINNTTVQYVEDKFWWGTEEDYNNLTELKEGSIYFVQL